MSKSEVLLDTVRVSKSSSLRISIPRRVASKLKVDPESIIGFYLDADGDIIIRRLS